MNYNIEFTKRAIRQLKSFPKETQRQLVALAESLSKEPRPDGCVAMAEIKGCYRIRRGDYRLVYTVRDDKLIVLVLSFGDRKDVYDKKEMDVLRKILNEWQQLRK